MEVNYLYVVVYCSISSPLMKVRTFDSKEQVEDWLNNQDAEIDWDDTPRCFLVSKIFDIAKTKYALTG